MPPLLISSSTQGYFSPHCSSVYVCVFVNTACVLLIMQDDGEHIVSEAVTRALFNLNLSPMHKEQCANIRVKLEQRATE